MKPPANKTHAKDEEISPQLDTATIQQLYDELARRCEGNVVLITDAALEQLTENRTDPSEAAIAVFYDDVWVATGMLRYATLRIDRRIREMVADATVHTEGDD